MKHKEFCTLGAHTGRCGRIVATSGIAHRDVDVALQPENDILFIRNRFSKAFAQIANVTELILDPVKAESMKSVLGGFLNDAEHDILIRIQDKLK